MITSRRRLGRLVVGLALTAVVLVGARTPASAHEGPAEITVTDQSQPAPLQVELTVGIIYALDEDPAAPARFDVSGTGPDGATVGPVALESTGTEGTYRAIIDFPAGGRWSLTFTSELPPGELVQEITVDDATTTAPPDTSSPGTAPADGSGSTATVEAAEEPTVVSNDGSDAPVGLIVGLIVAGLLVVGGAILVIRSRSRA